MNCNAKRVAPLFNLLILDESGHVCFREHSACRGGLVAQCLERHILLMQQDFSS